MIFEIRHTTIFTYERPVFLEPISVRLRPRCDCTQALHHHALTLTPAPAGGSETIDLDGNGLQAFWFDGVHASLRITAASGVETLRTNPFDFLLTEPEASILPLAYPQDLEPALKPYLARVQVTSEVDIFARDLRQKAGGATLPFLSLLTEGISTLCEQEVREEGEPMLPARTLAASKATCRDLSVLAMDVCRSVGLATRFVSGYQQSDEDVPYRHLHAWFEVYLPGGGWRGYDPTNGVAVADRHVVLCAGAEPRQAAPTSGSFRGTGVASQLKYELSIETRPGAG